MLKGDLETDHTNPLLKVSENNICEMFVNNSVILIENNTD